MEVLFFQFNLQYRPGRKGPAFQFLRLCEFFRKFVHASKGSPFNFSDTLRQSPPFSFLALRLFRKIAFKLSLVQLLCFSGTEKENT